MAEAGKSSALFLQMKDESPFAFAGISDERQADGKVIASCAIITTCGERTASKYS
jgi:putative SOS response-associated peptidase YedK